MTKEQIEAEIARLSDCIDACDIDRNYWCGMTNLSHRSMVAGRKQLQERLDRMTNEELAEQYMERANAEREAGSSIEINESLSYVAVTLGNDTEYFFQGEEAEDMLAEVPDWIHASDYILASAQNW